MGIEWRDIPGWEGFYQASSSGFIRSLPRKGRSEVKILIGNVGTWGYPSVGLSRDGKSRLCPVHKLIAASFFGPRPPMKVINHKNGIKTDNRVSNLEYISAQENYRHAVTKNLFRKKRPGTLKGQERTVRTLLAADIPASTISKVFNVHIRTVLRFKHGNNQY